MFGLDQHILVTLQLFCRFLSGCPVALAGTVNRKEPQQLGEVLRTQRVHDVIRGSGDICIALCHCVLCGSPCPAFWCFGRSKVTLFISFLLNSFFTATCLFAALISSLSVCHFFTPMITNASTCLKAQMMERPVLSCCLQLSFWTQRGNCLPFLRPRILVLRV